MSRTTEAIWDFYYIYRRDNNVYLMYERLLDNPDKKYFITIIPFKIK